MLTEAQKSKCMYCNSYSYGRGCLYSPHKIHVHLDTSLKCIYCGSLSNGPGCLYNPFGRNHIHGVEFNAMIKENVHNSFSAGILLSRLTQEIKDVPAYKLGLIDEKFNRLKFPESQEEKEAFTPLDAYIFKLRKYLGEGKIELLNSSVIIELLSKQGIEEQFDSEKYEQEVKIHGRVQALVEEYQNIMRDAVNCNISTQKVENMFIETLLTNE